MKPQILPTKFQTDSNAMSAISIQPQVIRTRIMPASLRLLRCGLFIVIFLSASHTWMSRGDQVDSQIDNANSAIKQNLRGYMGNYPGVNNDPNPVRRRFLGLGANDLPQGINYSTGIRLSLDNALSIPQDGLTPDRVNRLSRAINLGLESSIQGWLISGNIYLLEGLRITYPFAAGEQARPQNPSMPFGCLEAEFPFISLKDASRAQHCYAEGVRAMATVLSGHEGNTAGKVIIDIDTDPIPAPENGYPGTFQSERFAQYTWYVDTVNGTNTIFPIQTEGAMMGHLLQKQAQATQTIGYRLWTAAYFNSRTQRDPALRDRLKDEAVKAYHEGANLQFMACVALAAQVGDKAETTAESPFDLTKLRNVRANVAEAKSVIGQIRRNEKPTLPIDEVMAGDTQVNNLIATIAGVGAGSITRARTAYQTAQTTLFKVQDDAVLSFNEAQTRQTRFYDQLEALTGVPVPAAVIQTAAGQDQYRGQVAQIINQVMVDPNPDYSAVGQSELLRAIKQVRFNRQEVVNKQNTVDSFPARIKILEDTLGANISAIRTAEGKITAAQTSIGLNNAFRTTFPNYIGIEWCSSCTGISGDKWMHTVRASIGVSITIDPQAIEIADLQNDQTRASNLKEIQFLQNATAEQIRGLLIDQDLALGGLKSQVILLESAIDDVQKVIDSADRILAQLNAYDVAASVLYYNDPTFNQELTAEEEQANRNLNSLVANLYKLGKLLEFRWIEPFYNPVSVRNQQPQSLGDTAFDNFWSLESVFALGSVNVRDGGAQAVKPWQQGENFFNALRAWDQLLRSGIRAFDGDLAPVRVSLRQDVFGFADVKTVGSSIVPLDFNPLSNPNYLDDLAIYESNVRRFKNLLLNNGRYFYGAGGNQVGDKYRGLLLPFKLSYYDVGFTEGRLGVGNLFTSINAWNFRATKFKVKVIPLAGKNVFSQSTTPIIFAQAGLISNIDFFERFTGRVSSQRRVREINLDNYVKYDRDSLNQSDGPYLLFSYAKQNNFPTDAEIPTAADMLTRFWSPFCSRWLLQFEPSNNFEIENIDDIVIEIGLKSGAPNSPAW